MTAEREGTDTAERHSGTVSNRSGEGSFPLRFAPHLGLVSTEDGMFVESAGRDPIDQIKFAYDCGFCGVEDNFLRLRSADVQEKMGKTLRSRGMTMGCFLGVMVHDRPTFGTSDRDWTSHLERDFRLAIETAHRVGGTYITIIPGRRAPRTARETQLNNVAENLSRLGALAERAGVVMLVEAISRNRWSDILVSRVTDAHAICKDVGCRSVKVLFDIYQCQQETGDLIQNLDACWDEIGCIQVADNPGRCEPGTGEINFLNIFLHLMKKKWGGLIELEHGVSGRGVAGERLVLERYWELSRALRAPS
jgi:hydroxypyruvate isomerase